MRLACPQIDRGGRQRPVRTDDGAPVCSTNGGFATTLTTATVNVGSCGATAGAERQACPSLQSIFFECSECCSAGTGFCGQQSCVMAASGVALKGQACAAHAPAVALQATATESRRASQMERMTLNLCSEQPSGSSFAR